MVPPAIVIEIAPAYDTGTFKSGNMEGHAAPNMESGNPKLIKEI
jgi:hypothetical protein